MVNVTTIQYGKVEAQIYNKMENRNSEVFVNYLKLLYPSVVPEMKEYALFMIDKEGVIKTWDKGCHHLFGYSDQEIVGKNYNSLFSHPLVDKDSLKKELETAQNSGRYESQNFRRKKNGDMFWANNLLAKVRDEADNFVGYFVIIKDLSFSTYIEERLKAKNEELQDLNSEMDSFIYKASHDLKSPVSNIEGLVDCLMDELDESIANKDSVKQIHNLIRGSILKFRKTIGELAVTARIENKSKADPVEISFEEILDDLKLFLAKNLEKTESKIEADFSEVKHIKFSRKNLKTILLNLISNSLKFRSNDRRPVIKISTKKINEYVVLAVSDNGVGLEPEVKNRILNIFEKEGELNSGGGVGLLTISRILALNNGYVEIDSTPGKGTSIRIFLKCSPKPLNRLS